MVHEIMYPALDRYSRNGRFYRYIFEFQIFSDFRKFYFLWELNLPFLNFFSLNETPRRADQNAHLIHRKRFDMQQ